MAASSGAQPPSTKRKKIKELRQTSDKHAMPQFPRIQSKDRRDTAYLRRSGLAYAPKKQIDPEVDLYSPEVKFGRLLGATDQNVRHQAIRQLEMYLQARVDLEGGGVSELDLMKLWKGMWHTLYMADRANVQDELCRRIANLMWCLEGTEEEDEFAGSTYMDMTMDEDEGMMLGHDEEHDDTDDNGGSEESSSALDHFSNEDEESSDSPSEDSVELVELENTLNRDGEDEENSENESEEEDDSEIPHCRGAHLASLFVRTYLRTVLRDWGKLDKYRVDKFYTLSRYMLHVAFEYMAKRHWNLGIIRLFLDAIFEEALSKTPNGLRLHLTDIAIEELAEVQKKASLQLTEATFLDVMEPFFALAQNGNGDDLVHIRAMENVLERFLHEYSVVADKPKNESLVFKQVHVGTVAQFVFQIASSPDTPNRFRKALYDMYKDYKRLIQESGTDVDLDANAEYNDEHGDEMDGEFDDGVPQAYIEESDEDMQVKEEPVEMIEPEVLDDEIEEEVPVAAKPLEPAEDEPKSKKSERKKRKLSSDSVNSEQEITISIEEQQSARRALKKSKEELSHERNDKKAKKDASDRGGKKVKFRSVNEARSYKLSMKNLRTKAINAFKVSRPDRGILLESKHKADTDGPKKGKKSRRKKAKDYF